MTVTISPVGSTVSVQTPIYSTLTNVLAISPVNNGDILVFALGFSNSPIATISTISGGGVTTWNRVIYDDSSGGGIDVEIWYGVVTSTGAADISLTFTAGGGYGVLFCQEFTPSAACTWAVDTSASTTTLLTSFNYPSLIPAGSGELYYGVFAGSGGTGAAGNTTGCTYDYQYNGSATYISVYDPSVSGALSPNGTGPGSWAAACACLIVATSTGMWPLPSPFVVRQAANRADTYPSS